MAMAAVNDEPQFLVVNGSVPLGTGGFYTFIGGDSAETVLRRSTAKAPAVRACALPPAGADVAHDTEKNLAEPPWVAGVV